MFRTLAICALAGLTWSIPLLAQQISQVQIGQSRQLSPLPGTVDLDGQRNAPDFPNLEEVRTEDDAFGAQVILKREERRRPFAAFSEIGAFVTNNVALTRRGREQDNFLVGSVGAGWSEPLTPELAFNARISGSAYRYDRFRELDFQSIDFAAGLSWMPPRLSNTELFLRYSFTELTTADDGEEFYKNHAVLLGAQKVVPISRAQAAYFGASAQWSWADPADAGRDEYIGYAGYRVALTRSWSADFYYRYGRYVYRDADNRQDNNHTLSLTFQYAPVTWATLSATSFLGFNRSNQEVFNYDVANVGVGLQLAVKF